MRGSSHLGYGAVAGFLTLMAVESVAAKPDPVMGRLLARAACTYCHIVTEDQGFAPPAQPQGPAFSAIAANPKSSAKQLRRFLLTTHKDVGNGTGMPNPLLTNQQIENIVAFILSQRRQPGAKD